MSIATDKKIFEHRIAYLREELEKAIQEHDFANGYRAGLQCAVDAMNGRDTIGVSIDPKPKKRT